MDNALTREGLRALMREVASGAPTDRGRYRVYLVGSSTAVWAGWREGSLEAELFSEHDELFWDVHEMKERLGMNIAFYRPEDSVPRLPGVENRHVFVEAIEPVDFYHYDPYSQLFSRIVRGFAQDLEDARHFVSSGMAQEDSFREILSGLSGAAFARYPRLSRRGVARALEAFLSEVGVG